MAGTLITWDIWAVLHLVSKHHHVLTALSPSSCWLEKFSVPECHGQEEKTVLLKMLLQLIAVLLYTLYGHQLWSRRNQLLHAVGWIDEK